MPWAGQEVRARCAVRRPCSRLTPAKGCLIDRYDGRALLDMIAAPPARASAPSPDELLLERRAASPAVPRPRSFLFSFLNYERYRDLGALLAVLQPVSVLTPALPPHLTHCSRVSAARPLMGRLLADTKGRRHRARNRRATGQPDGLRSLNG